MEEYLYFNEEAIDGDFFCPICLNVFIEPMVHQCCNNTFCKSCITTTCPLCRKEVTEFNFLKAPRVYTNLLDKLTVICQLCHQMVSRGLMTSHKCKDDQGSCSLTCIGTKFGCDGIDFQNMKSLLLHQQICPSFFQALMLKKMASIESTNHKILQRLEILEATNTQKEPNGITTVILNEKTVSNYLTSWSEWWGRKLRRDTLKLTVQTLGPSCVSCRSVAPLNFSDSFYFEVIILNAGESCAVAVGLLGEHKQYLEKMPGWSSGIGYHADNGYVYKPSGEGRGSPFGPVYQTGDVIGCGYNHRNDSLFFVKNGEMISSINAPRLETAGDEKLFAAIGFQSNNASASINFGATNFLYKGVRRIVESQH